VVRVKEKPASDMQTEPRLGLSKEKAKQRTIAFGGETSRKSIKKYSKKSKGMGKKKEKKRRNKMGRSALNRTRKKGTKKKYLRFTQEMGKKGIRIVKMSRGSDKTDSEKKCRV